MAAPTAEEMAEWKRTSPEAQLYDTPWQDIFEPYLHSFNETERELIRKYYHACWLTHSPHCPDNGHGPTAPTVFNLKHVLQHAIGNEAELAKLERREERAGRNERRTTRKERDAAATQRGAAYIQWANDCAARNAWIEEANIEWRKRVSARKAILAQWDAYVSDARTEFDSRKCVPAPVRPTS